MMNEYNYMLKEEADNFTPDEFDLQITLGLQTCKTKDDVLKLLKDVRLHERAILQTEKQPMPYLNEHSARLLDPADFQPESFRRKEIVPGISIIIGRLKGEETATTQAYRFDRTKFTPAEAKEWLKEHDVKYTEFEKATGKD